MSIQLLDKQTIDNSAVTGNGLVTIWESAEIDPQQSDTAFDVYWKFENKLPDPEALVTQNSQFLAIQKKDIAGNWHTFWTQPQGFFKSEQGFEFSLEYGPNINNDSPEQPFESSLGDLIVAREYTKQGHVPDKIRFCIIVDERKYGEPGAFQSVDVTMEYRLFPV